MSTEREAGSWKLICVVSTAIIVVLSVAVALWGVLPGEVAIRETLIARTSPGMKDVARSVGHAGRWPVLLTATVILLAASRAARGRWWLWCLVLVLAPLLGEAWQEIIARPRPQASALGFPSGHATSAATFCVLVMYLVSRAAVARVYRLAVQVLSALTMLGVGLARILLGAHWPADVVVGFGLGFACVAAAAWWDTTHVTARSSAGGRWPSSSPA